MKINAIQNNRQFSGLYNNKTLLRGLEHISDNSASFSVATAFLSSMLLRPLSIHLTPKSDKENKKMLSLDAIASATTKFLLSETVILPIEMAIKKIDKNPNKYLNKDTITNLSEKSKDVTKSKNYKFMTQIIKQGTNILSSIPKSIISVAILPILFGFFDNKNNKNENKSSTLNVAIQKDKNNKLFNSFNNNISFNGKYQNIFTTGVSKIINSKKMQKFVTKYSNLDKNLAKNSAIFSDVVLTLNSIVATKKSKKIDNQKKKLLVTNKMLGTTFSIFMGYSIDKIVQNLGKNFMDKFIQINKNNPKINKYIDGINVLRPTIIFAFIYYGIIPIITTFMSDKMVKNQNQEK